jgi:hypothetical protein
MSKLNMVSREFLERAAGVRRVGFRTWQVGGRRMRLLRRFWQARHRWYSFREPMSEPTKPALTAMEWNTRRFRREARDRAGCVEVFIDQRPEGDDVIVIDDLESGPPDIGDPQSVILDPGQRHAVAAACLYGQPFGFTWEDVHMLLRHPNTLSRFETPEESPTPSSGAVFRCSKSSRHRTTWQPRSGAAPTGSGGMRATRSGASYSWRESWWMKPPKRPRSHRWTEDLAAGRHVASAAALTFPVRPFPPWTYAVKPLFFPHGRAAGGLDV